jgi:acetyl esterase
MSLTPATKAYFQKLEEQKNAGLLKPISQISLEDYRKKAEILLQFAMPAEDIEYRDDILIGPDDNKITLRIYNGSDETFKPTMIFFPGGGFIVDLTELHHSPCSIMAKKSGYQVIMVTTQLAPEYAYPAGVNAAYFATKYLYENADKFFIDRSRFIVAGDSSGSNFASLVVNKARHDPLISIYHQILISPDVDLTRSIKTHVEFEKYDAILTQEVVAYIYDHYMPDKECRKLPQVSPYWEEDLSGLPPTTIILSEYDGIRSDGEGYYEKLLKFGVQVKIIVVKGVTHHAMILRKIFYDGEDPANITAEILSSLR